MKKVYHVIVETMDGSAKYETTVSSKYDVKEARDEINIVKPETLISIGTDLVLHAGDVKAILITGEEDAEDGTV